MDLQKLKSVIAAQRLSGTTFEICAALSAQSETEEVRVSLSEIQRYLAREGVLDALEDQSKAGNKKARRIIGLFSARYNDIRLKHPRMQSAFDLLIADNNIPFTNTHKQALTAMGSRQISIAQKEGLGSVYPEDIDRMMRLTGVKV